MKIIKKNFFPVFLFCYLIIGSITSLNTGISFDEYHEEKNWKFHVSLTKHLTNHIISGEEYDKKFDKEYKSYLGYGVGFQIVSQPIQFFVKKILLKTQKIDNYGAHLTAKHFVVFLFFFLSGIFFYLILKKIINDRLFCSTTSILYLLYPYLFGQSLFSPKDVPFMSVWILCTYISFKVFDKILKKNNISMLTVFSLALSTAFLLSIRIAGILIFIQYLVTFIIYINSSSYTLIYFLKKFLKEIITFTISLIFLTLLLYPPFWLNPLLIFNAISHMANYFNDVCTNTLGSCMHPKNLPSTYIPIWLSVKLPLFVIIGIFLIPFTEKRIFINPKKNIFFGTILITPFLIILVLILKKVHLYDELRQIMFLVPILFILGSVSLYIFSKKIFYPIGVFMIALFVFENIKINPYQYVWFNLPSRYIDLTNKFELEYQGISGREIASYISSSKYNNSCILVNPLHTLKPYLNPKRFNCFAVWQAIDTNYKRPFLAVQHVRNIKKGKSYKCETIYTSSFKLLFHKKKFIAGKLLQCS